MPEGAHDDPAKATRLQIDRKAEVERGQSHLQATTVINQAVGLRGQIFIQDYEEIE